MTREEQFSEVTNSLLKYDTGDFLLLSDIEDSVSNLKDSYLEMEAPYALIQWLMNLIRLEMNKAGQPDFIEKITRGIDLLQEWGKNNIGKGSRNIEGKMREFIGHSESSNQDLEPQTQNDEAFQIFLTDAADRLVQAQSLILALEQDFSDLELVDNLFRVFHTIKGECGFLRIAPLGELTHNVENLLDLLRSKKMVPNSEIIEILLEGLDLSQEIVKKLSNKDSQKFDYLAMKSYIQKLGKISSKSKHVIGDLLVQNGKLRELDISNILQKQKESTYTKKFGEIAVREKYLSQKELQVTLEKQKNSAGRSGQRESETHDPIIKVRASKVNFLVDMIGELLITMGQLSETTPTLAQMRKITRSIQFGAMELRTETIRTLFSNMKRVIRDLSKKLNKPVKLELYGEDLEIDRNLIEKLEEPLIHLVRNSLDHGVEPPEARLELSKEPQGTIRLGAERLGNSIVITIGDDGEGLSRKKIIEKAIAKGFVQSDTAEAMTDSQVYDLIFTSGFSTSENIDQISGRGVGMDIVRTAVSNCRGQIKIDSKLGQYTRFKLSFPLSTAIIDGMVVRIGGNLFIIPISSIIESIKVLPENIFSVNNKVEMINLRGEASLVLRMHLIFGLTPPSADKMLIGIVVKSSDHRIFIFLVDEIIAKREIVIKPLGRRFDKMKGITSGTVLSGGRIGLVLDVDQVIELSLMEAYH